jgi:hypothetical protein
LMCALGLSKDNKKMSLLEYLNTDAWFKSSLEQLEFCSNMTHYSSIFSTTDKGDNITLNAWTSRNLTTIKQFNFLHIPKAAGTSLNNDLSEKAKRCHVAMCHVKPHTRESEDDYCRKSNDALVGGHQEYGLVPAARSRGVPSMYITILRHPLSRVPSLYHYILKSQGHFLHKEVKGMSLMEFVSSIEESQNRMTMLLCGVSENSRCRKPLYALSRAVQHLINDFAVVGLQECFSNSLSLIGNLMPWIRTVGGLSVRNSNVNIGYNKKFLHSNSTSIPTLSNEEVDLILNYNQLDVHVYGVGLQLFKAAQLNQPTWIMSQHHQHIIDCNSSEQQKLYASFKLQQQTKLRSAISPPSKVDVRARKIQLRQQKLQKGQPG